MARKNIRNFCIIAHIDHGKSTLSDRMLELTDSVDKRTMTDQVLDNMDIEKERGITIKARAVTMRYKADDGETYEFNLIDTPGHVDFQYEVSRSLAACEGAVLVVDASQGVEAQTLANCYLALDHDLEVVPILNKIDLPSADPDAVAKEVEDVIGLPCMEAPRVSAKLGIGVKDVLECVVRDVPAPTGDPTLPLKALIFDSIYDSYKGVIVYVRIFEGTVKPGDTIRLMSTGAEFQLVEVGHMGATSLTPCDKLEAGEVGYLTASIKTVRDTRVGDTVTLAATPTPEPLPGFRTVTPMVFCGIYPADGADYPDLKDALEKLQLNDASLTFEPETSAALGFGFRCGFLRLLHMEIITERLEREFDLDLITTTPGVQYRLTLTDGTVEVIDNPSAYPDPTRIVKQEEPFVNAHIYTPNDYVGPLMDLCQTKRGVLVDMKYMDDDYSNGLKDAFIENCEANGIEVTYTGECMSTDTDYSSQAAQAVASGAELLYYPCFLDTVPLLVGAARNAGFTGAIMGGDAWDGSDTTGLSTQFDDCYFTNHYSSEDTAPVTVPGTPSLARNNSHASS